MASLTPITPQVKSTNSIKSGDFSSTGLITPKQSPIIQPNNYQYYNCHLNKLQFNNILINCVSNLLKILYKEKFNYSKLKYFIIEILKRSKTSIQILQLTCWYLMKLINTTVVEVINDPRKLFLGLIIIASKFNQDFNYSFSSWLKICGLNNNSSNFNIKDLKILEIDCLKLLDYKIYLNNLNYENWCNILIIFGYDFLKVHYIILEKSQLIWFNEISIIDSKLTKWENFFTTNLNIVNLSSVKINFNNYYSNQLGKKIIIKSNTPSLFTSTKRCHDENEEVIINKKIKTY
jgi:hypothetical protein